MLNTLFEYVLNIYLGWYQGSLFYIQYNLQFGCFSDSCLFIGNYFIARFYYEIFVKEVTILYRQLLLAYKIATICLVLLYVFGLYFIDLTRYFYKVQLPDVIAYLANSPTKIVFILVHTLIIFVPLILNALILRRKLQKEDSKENAEVIRKLLFVFWMGIAYFTVFLFNYLDSLGGKQVFPIWYYLGFASEIVTVLLAYFGIIRKIKK